MALYDLTSLAKKTLETSEWLKAELAGVRTGRATPLLLEGVRVSSYGTLLPLHQVANITVEDARTLRVTPWDQSQIKNIESALQEANLGVSVGSDDKGVRVFFPELTTERREQLMKVVRSKLEEARVTLRQHRDHTWADIQKQEKEGQLSEDDKFRSKDAMEKTIQDGNKRLEESARKKEEELKL